MSIEVRNLRRSFGSFAVASVLTFLALVTLALKTLVEWQQGRARADRAEPEPERIAA